MTSDSGVVGGLLLIAALLFIGFLFGIMKTSFELSDF